MVLRIPHQTAEGERHDVISLDCSHDALLSRAATMLWMALTISAHTTERIPD